MRGRRVVLVAAATALAVWLTAREPWQAVRSRVAFLRLGASQDLATRRLNGSSTGFDRNYFVFLELARRRLPPEAPGVAVFPERPIPGSGVYLTIYHFAPLPALVEPENVPPGWIAAVYGTERPAGWRVLRELPHGALLAP